jgi:hypothetical protein
MVRKRRKRALSFANSWKRRSAKSGETQGAVVQVPTPSAPILGFEPIQVKLRATAPQTEAQWWLLSRALQISGDIEEAHWLMFERSEAGFPWPFLTILVFWLVTLFVTFGLLAPRNASVLCIIFSCSLSVASAVFLIVDMEHPFFGFIQVSSAPLRDALDQLGR